MIVSEESLAAAAAALIKCAASATDDAGNKIKCDLSEGDARRAILGALVVADKYGEGCVLSSAVSLLANGQQWPPVPKSSLPSWVNN